MFFKSVAQTIYITFVFMGRKSLPRLKKKNLFENPLNPVSANGHRENAARVKPYLKSARFPQGEGPEVVEVQVHGYDPTAVVRAGHPNKELAEGCHRVSVRF